MEAKMNGFGKRWRWNWEPALEEPDEEREAAGIEDSLSTGARMRHPVIAGERAALSGEALSGAGWGAATQQSAAPAPTDATSTRMRAHPILGGTAGDWEGAASRMRAHPTDDGAWVGDALSPALPPLLGGLDLTAPPVWQPISRGGWLPAEQLAQPGGAPSSSGAATTLDGLASALIDTMAICFAPPMGEALPTSRYPEPQLALLCANPS